VAQSVTRAAGHGPTDGGCGPHAVRGTGGGGGRRGAPALRPQRGQGGGAPASQHAGGAAPRPSGAPQPLVVAKLGRIAVRAKTIDLTYGERNRKHPPCGAEGVH
jgi:hypothetical protein